MSLNLREIGRILSVNQRPNGEVDPKARAAIVTAVALGEKRTYVAECFKVSPSAITRIVQRFSTNATFDSAPRKGRPEALMPREKRELVRTVHRDFRVTHKELLVHLSSSPSISIVRRTLHDENLAKWKAKKRIHLSP